LSRLVKKKPKLNMKNRKSSKMNWSK